MALFIQNSKMRSDICEKKIYNFPKKKPLELLDEQMGTYKRYYGDKIDYVYRHRLARELCLYKIKIINNIINKE